MSFLKKIFLSLTASTFIPGAVLLASYKAQAATIFEGVFSSTIPACQAGQVCNGFGTNSFNFGSPASTSFNTALTFETSNFATRPSGEFLIGTLNIRNGSIFQDSYPGTDNGSVRNTIINLDLTEITNGVPGVSDTLRIAYGGTLNANPDLRSPQNADIVYFPDFPELGQINILEGDTVENATYNVGILAKFGSIIPVSFVSQSGEANGFLSALGPTEIDPTTGEPVVTAQVPTPALLPGLIGIGMVHLRSMFKRKKTEETV